MSMLSYLREELAELEIAGFTAQEAPSAGELRLLAGMFGHDSPERLEERGDPKRPARSGCGSTRVHPNALQRAGYGAVWAAHGDFGTGDTGSDGRNPGRSRHFRNGCVFRQ